MAKLSKSQSFKGARIYFDDETRTWFIDEESKEGTSTYRLVEDVLLQWADFEGLTISIKQDIDYIPARMLHAEDDE